MLERTPSAVSSIWISIVTVCRKGSRFASSLKRSTSIKTLTIGLTLGAALLFALAGTALLNGLSSAAQPSYIAQMSLEQMSAQGAN